MKKFYNLEASLDVGGVVSIFGMIALKRLSAINPLLDSFHFWIRFIAGFVPLLDTFHCTERNNQSN